MKFLFPFIAIIFNACISYSQSFETDWRHCFGHIGMDEANDMIKTNSGYYILGTANAKDIWLIKTDLEGNLLWDKNFGGTQVDYSMRLIPTLNGQFYIVGGTFSNDGDITFDPYPFSRDYWIVKIDSLGNKLWDKVYGGNDKDEVWTGCYSDIDEVVAAGWSLSVDGDVSVNFGMYDMWILKVDSTGDKVWNTIIGTNGQDIPSEIKQTGDKGYILGGTSVSMSQPSGNIPCVDPYQQAELVINKLDSLGNIEWSRCYGGSEKEGLGDILELSDGYIAAGWSNSNDGDLLDCGYHIGFWNTGDPTGDTWIIKLDFNGNILWKKCYGGTRHEYPTKLFQTEKGFRVFNVTYSQDGDVLGNNSITDDYSDIWTFEIDSVGNLLSSQCFGSLYDESLYDGVFKLSDAQYTIAAQAMSYEWNCVEENDIVLFKITDTLINGISNNVLPNLVNAYPNPAHQVINFNNTGPFPVIISISNPLGIKEDELLLSPGSNSIQLLNYCAGIYIYQYNTSGQIITGKFIVY